MATSDKYKSKRYRTIAKTCYAANITYLLLHIYYLIHFLIAKLMIPAYITIGVIALYLLMFLLIKFHKYYPYALVCGNEFFIYIIVMTIMLGFNTGFYFFLIAFCVVSFFTSYFSKSKSLKGSIIWVGLSIIIYLTLYIVTSFIKPLYEVEKWAEMSLFITHSVIAFILITAFLVIFLKYAFSLEKKIMNESRTDELTQIANRYGLYDYFEHEQDKIRKVLALIDVDDFKNINDKYGHVTGDYVLQTMAKMIDNGVEDSFTCRYGGEEFVIVLDYDKDDSYYSKLENLRKRIEAETFEFEGVKIKLTITVGAVKYKDGYSLEKWVELADEKMYQGKKSGKNKIVI